MKRKRTSDDMHSDDFCLLPGAMVAIMIAPYLDPSSRVNLIHAKNSLEKHLCQFYCSKHGTTLPDSDGLCKADVEEKIQHDGHDVEVFRARLTVRTAKVDPDVWYRDTLPRNAKPMPLDCDPIYQKYLIMMKECPECETEATNAAMAGIGLAPPCLNCHQYVSAEESFSCRDCKQFTCTDCGHCPKCDKWYCLACRPYAHCAFCSRYGCEDSMELTTCIVCRRKMCSLCQDSELAGCDNCNEGFCADHGMNDCTFCGARFCTNCKDSANRGHKAGCPRRKV